MALGVAIDVLIKHFGEEKFSDEKKLGKIEEDMLLSKESIFSIIYQQWRLL